VVENSLRRLGTDWIDLYQVHRPEDDIDIDIGAPGVTISPVDVFFDNPALAPAARRRAGPQGIALLTDGMGTDVG
jgi:hypothetical protein